MNHSVSSNSNDAVPAENRWASRAFLDGFEGVREQKEPAKKSPINLSEARCKELARQHQLHVADWIELVGAGIGQHWSYMVNEHRINFRKWEAETIAGEDLETQKAMVNDNRTAPELAFPCSPSQLLKFVDTALGSPEFTVPDAFRDEVKRLDTSETETAESDHSKTKRKSSTRGSTVKETIKPYVAELKKRFPKLTGKLLHSEAEKEAGSESSPFKAHKRGEVLMLKDCHRPCSIATFEQVLSQIEK